MKKIIVIAVILVIVYQISSVKADQLVIPKDAIRIRVVANSDSAYDQEVKQAVSEEIQKSMYHLLKNTKGVNSARKVINSHINELEVDVENILKRLDYDLGYEINYGMNYFPNKEFHGVTYNEGYYESLLVTLGEGKGKNWWCVLFPPLCLIEAEESEQVEYKFFVKELIEKYL